jgi:hypothetical protein
LLLPDGTALSGIAFVSNTQPIFTSQLSSTGDKNELESATSPNSSSLPPLTLTQEQQDDLGLSIEMVRHAPISIIEVIEAVGREEDGTMVKPKRGISMNSRENLDQFKVSYEASGGIRMYVDPAHQSSVAYMERFFCYDEGEGEDDSRTAEGENGEEDHDEEKRDEAEGSNTKRRVYRSTNNVLILSLDKSYRYTLKSLTDGDDVFADQETSSHDYETLGSGATTEAVLMGVKTRGLDGTTIELHVGQKVVRKRSKEGVPLSGSDQKSPFRSGLRPDDPAPRGEWYAGNFLQACLMSIPSTGLSRILSARYPATSHLTGRKLSFSSSSSSTSLFIAPQPPVSKTSLSAARRPDISVLPSGGSAACSNPSRPSSMPNLKRENSIDQLAREKKRSKTVSKAADISTLSDDGGDRQERFEERNRSLIKKLVHHQLLGRGVEKKDEDYLACFNSTCNGTVLALRKQIKTEVIDKVVVASIIEKHLYMYL